MTFYPHIHPSHRRYLCFQLNNEHYQYRVLLFTLSLAPRLFSKNLAVLAAHLFHLDIIVFPSLDDWLIKGRSCWVVLESVKVMSSLFHSLDLQIDLEWSVSI